MHSDTEQLQYVLPQLHIMVCENLSTKYNLTCHTKYLFHELQTRTQMAVSVHMLPSASCPSTKSNPKFINIPLLSQNLLSYSQRAKKNLFQF
jgi:hypothetical protein